eukprot:TCONS_00052733-protein
MAFSRSQDQRRQSNTSSLSALEDDPLLRDCIGLRQRLLDTEKSLQNLTISTATPKISPNDSLRAARNETDKSILSDHAPILTLADLTPSGSVEDTLDTHPSHQSSKQAHNRPYSSLGEIDSGKAFQYEKDFNPITSLTQCRHHEDINTFRQKILVLREENSKMFLQNNKLMTELEKRTYKLQDCQSQLQEMNIAVKESKELKGCSVERMNELDSQLKRKTQVIRQMEKIVGELRTHLNQQDTKEREEKERFDTELDSKEKHIQELTSKIASIQKKDEERLKEFHTKEVKMKEELISVQQERNDFRLEADKMKQDNFKQQEQLTLIKSKTIELQNVAIELSATKSENTKLKTLIDKQQIQIKEYNTEIANYKNHVEKLEGMVQKVQEDTTTPRPDSGIGILSENHQDGNQSGTPRSIIADLKLKLAMKDTEMHKLKAIVANNSILQQKFKSDCDIENVNIKGLRSELTSVVERSRKGDIKQMELEHTITRLQEDISSKTRQLVELNDRLNDKTHLVQSLEMKLDQKNGKLLEYQKELTNKDEHYEELEHQLQKSIKSLSDSMTKTKVSITEKDRQLSESKSLLETYSSQIKHLENALDVHNQETEATDALVHKIKNLHADHCHELENEISKWRQVSESKTQECIEMESLQHELLKEKVGLEESVKDLKDYVIKMEELDGEKKNMIKAYKDKIKSIQGKANEDSQSLQQLQTSLDHCKTQLQNALQEYDQSKQEHQKLIDNKTKSIDFLTDDLNIKTKHITEIEESYKKALEMLEQSQKRIADLEDTSLRHVNDVAMEKQTNEELNQEIQLLHQKIDDLNGDIDLYQEQVETMNQALDEAKHKFKEVGVTLQNRDVKLMENSKQIQKLINEIEKLNLTKTELTNQLNGYKTNTLNLEKTIQIQKEKYKACSEKCQGLENRVSNAHDKLRGYEASLQNIESTKIKTNEKLEYTQRLLTTSQGESNMKIKELNQCRLQIHEMENAISESEWKVKQKSALYTQLEMSCKQERSELEKQISTLTFEVDELKGMLQEKENKIKDQSSNYEELRIDYDERNLLCEDLRNQLRMQEEANIHASSEVKILKGELNQLIEKVHQQSEFENEANIVKEQYHHLNTKVQNLQNQLMTSQQTIINLTNELEESHSMMSQKESDCTRLARELGASQVREAQEKSRLNQELRETIQNHDFKFSQKLEEMDSLREKNDDLVTTQQQDILKLRLALQRSEDETRLAKNDLERRKERVGELETSVRELTFELQEQQQRCKELDEMLVIREAETARHSARASGLEREIFTNRSAIKSYNHKPTNQSNVSFHQNPTNHTQDIHETSNTLIQTLKKQTELDKLRSQASDRRNSLEDLLKRTEAELKDLDMTGFSNSLDTTQQTENGADNESLISGVSSFTTPFS